jgi:hypothetical protein
VPGRAEAAGLDAGAYTVPYVAGWSGGEPAGLHAAATTVTAAARRIIAQIDNPAQADGATAAEGDGAAQTDQTGASERPSTRPSSARAA